MPSSEKTFHRNVMTAAMPAVFCAAYFLAAVLAGALAAHSASGDIPAFQPIAGLYMAVLILVPFRRWPLFMFAALPAHFAFAMLLHHQPAAPAAYSFIGNSAAAAGGAYMMKRFVSAAPSLSTLRQVVAFCILPVLAAPVLSATIGLLPALGMAGGERAADLWPAWWIADAVGIIIFAPFVITMLRRPSYRRKLTLAKGFEAAAILAVGLGIVFFVYSLRRESLFVSPEYVFIPVMVWAALRFGVRGAAATVLIASIATLRIVTHGFIDTPPSILEHRTLFEVQAFIAFVSFAGLCFGALQEERRTAEDSTAEQLKLSLMLNASESYNEALRLLLEAGLKVSGMESGGVYAVEPETDDLRLIHHINLSEGFIEKTSVFPKGSPQQKTVAAGVPTYGAIPESAKELARDERLRLAVVLPIVFEGKAVACLNLATKTAGALHKNTKHALETISAQAAAAIARLSAQGKTHANEQRLDLALSASAIGMWEFDIGKRKFFSDHRLREIMGYLPDSMNSLFKSPQDVLHPEDLMMILGKYSDFIGGKTSGLDFEFRGRHASGEWRWLYLRAGATETSQDGRPLKIAGTVADITKRHEQEEAVRIAEQTYRSIAENMPGIVYRLMIKDKGGMIFFNNMVETMTGFSTTELTKGEICSIDPIIIPADKDKVISEVRRSLEEKRAFQIEYRIRHRDGEYRYFHERGQPLFDENGEPLCINGVILDVTGLKLAEKELREREQMLRSLVEDTSDIIALQALDGRYIFFNCPSAYDLSAGEVEGKYPRDILPPKAAARIMESISRVERAGINVDFVDRTIWNGEDMWFANHIYPVHDADGAVIAAGTISRNITKLKKAENELKYRFSIEQLIATLSTHFVNLETGKAGPAIKDALRRISLFTEVDRAFIALLDNQCSVIDSFIEWGKPDMPPLKETYEGFDVSRFKWCIGKLRNGEVIFSQNPESLPPEAAPEREMWSAGGIKTLVLLPLMYKRELIGFFSLITYGNEKDWKIEDIRLLSLAAELFAGIIMRGRQEDENAAYRTQIESALAEKTLLMKEIHHRVKNNLQIIASLLDMQSMSAGDRAVADALADARAKINSIALVHTHLYQTEDLGAISMQPILTEIASFAVSSLSHLQPGVKINARAENFRLEITQAIPCALIASELVSNCMKHAFPEGRGPAQPEISIFLTESGGEAVLIVKDNGAGLPADFETIAAKSFGMKIVRALATEQLGGALHATSDCGTEISVVFPMNYK